MLSVYSYRKPVHLVIKISDNTESIDYIMHEK